MEEYRRHGEWREGREGVRGGKDQEGGKDAYCVNLAMYCETVPGTGYPEKVTSQYTCAPSSEAHTCAVPQWCDHPRSGGGRRG